MYSNEIRKLTVMIISLEVNSKKDKELHEIITITQKLTFNLEGSLYKLLIDNNTLKVICTWRHNAAQALLCALQIEEELKSFEVKIAVSTGIAFTGIINSNGSRKEYIVISEAIKRAEEIIMQCKGSVCVDWNSKQEASNKFCFKSIGKVLKDDLKFFVYEPMQPKVNMLLVRANPFLFNAESRNMVGRIKLLEKAKKDFDLFMKDGGKTNIGVIAGVTGSGKTLFAKTILEHIIQVKEVKVFGSFLNPLTKKNVLGNWRHIILSITESLAIGSNTTRQKFIQGILEQYKDINIKLLSEILELPSINNQPLVNSEDNSLHELIVYLFELLTKDCTVVIFLDDCNYMDKVSIY